MNFSNEYFVFSCTKKKS